MRSDTYARVSKRKLLTALLAAACFLLLLLTADTYYAEEAASQPSASVTACQLTGKRKLQVKATLTASRSIPKKTIYLFALEAGASNKKIKASIKPLKTLKLKKTSVEPMSLTINVKKSKTAIRDIVNSKFVLAIRKGKGKYQIISAPRYITNPYRAAKYNYAFPTVNSKKGLQVSGTMPEDANELNIRHSVLNIVFSEMIATSAEHSKEKAYSYKYRGKKYWFKKSVIQSYDRQLLELKQSDAVVSAVLLLGRRSDLDYLIPPGGRVSGHSFYAWNMNDKKARGQLEAAVSFLAERYASKKAENGRIVNWIVGNEVDSYSTWNYAGNLSLTNYARLYAAAFRMVYNTVASTYKNARVYISLDHLWNTKIAGGFTASSMLEAFVSALEEGGYIPWNLAYHPYSSPLTEPKFWENKNKQLTDELTSPVINMGNLSLLTNYIRSHYGAGCRIILSEQGFTSKQKDKDVSAEQSAAIVYSYYLTESDPQVDSFIMNRQVDHVVEEKQGLALGLWNNDAISDASTKKPAWSVFKYMDTNSTESVASPALSVIGAEKWEDLIPGYNASAYMKTTIDQANLTVIGGYKVRGKIASGWKAYGPVLKNVTVNKKKKTYSVSRAGGNRNRGFGFVQNFKKKLSFSNKPVFVLNLKAEGAKAGKVIAKVRFLSGTHVLECEQEIKAGKNTKLGVSLAAWPYRSKVSRIEVSVVCPQGWNSGASVTMKNPGRAK